ncbi:MAG: zf-HC2 domain-containing protein [Anaerolineae bacterium]|nr:zf-HC2 domain-containing protein [Anaerolineae bacterium]
MFNWKHRRIKALLPLYGDESLSPGERKAIEEHLQVCDECRAEWESLRWAISLIKEAPQVPAPRLFVVRAADLERTSVPIGFYVARAFTALAAAAFFLLLGFDLLTIALGKAPTPVPMIATVPEVTLTPTPALEPSPQLDTVRSLPMIPSATEEREVNITREIEALVFKSPLLTPEPSPPPAETPTPTPTPMPAPLLERKPRFPLRWLPLEIAVGVSALAGGVISWILRRRK